MDSLPISSLDKLDDDSIMEILTRLTIHDAFRLEGLFGHRFDDLVSQRIRRCHSLRVNLRTFPSYTAAQLMVIGRNLRTLDVQAGYSISTDTVLNTLAPLLESAAASQILYKLKINYINFNTVYLHEINKVAVQLLCLDLSYCDLNDELFGELVSNCLDLKELIILGNYQVEGDFLKKLPTTMNEKIILKHLAFEKHTNWKFDIPQFASVNPTLEIIAFNPGCGSSFTYNTKSKKLISTEQNF